MRALLVAVVTTLVLVVYNTNRSPDREEVHQKIHVTVVSAYYELESKHSAEEYFQWTNNFLRLSCYRILFCDTHCDRFKALRDERLMVVEWPLADTEMAFLEPMWNRQFALDPERAIHRSHWLYIVWAQKAWFVKRAQELNPFGSTHFIWMDAGAIRDSKRLPLLANWPKADKVREVAQDDRIVALTIQPFPTEAPAFLVGDYIGGTSFVASAKGWDRFRELYWQTLVKGISLGEFVGKDQTVYNNMYLAKPHWFTLIDARVSSYDPWFYMQDLLA